MLHRIPMLRRLRERQPHTPIVAILAWSGCHLITFVWFMLCYRVRWWGSHHVPDRGTVLLVSNHQSYLDPILVGLGAHKRQFRPLARKTLWDAWFYRRVVVPIFSPIPVDQEAGTGDLRAMRGCIDVLKAGHALLLFPEGARTPDGQIHAFQAGLMLVVKRANTPVVPVAVAGAFDAWPRGRKLPRLWGRVACLYGEPIPPEQLTCLTPEAARALLRDAVDTLHAELQRRLQA